MNLNFEYYKVFYYVSKYGSPDPGCQCPDDKPAGSDPHYPQPGKRNGMPLVHPEQKRC